MIGLYAFSSYNEDRCQSYPAIRFEKPEEMERLELWVRVAGGDYLWFWVVIVKVVVCGVVWVVGFVQQFDGQGSTERL